MLVKYSPKREMGFNYGMSNPDDKYFCPQNAVF